MLGLGDKFKKKLFAPEEEKKLEIKKTVPDEPVVNKEEEERVTKS